MSGPGVGDVLLAQVDAALAWVEPKFSGEDLMYGPVPEWARPPDYRGLLLALRTVIAQSEVHVPASKVQEKIDEHQRRAQRAFRREDSEGDPVITSYCAKVATLHLEFSEELRGLISGALDASETT